MRGAARYGEEFSELSESLTQLRCLAEDAAERVSDLFRGLNFSPEELDELESRLDVIYRLKKKYGSTVAEMLDYLEQCHRELDEIQFADDTIARLEKEQQVLLKGAKSKAELLSEKRKKAAEQLQVSP